MRINWRRVGISLCLGAVGGLIVGVLVSRVGSSNSEVIATWFSAIGTVAAVVVSLITSRGAVKIAKYTGMYEEHLNVQIQELLEKVEALFIVDKIGPKAYPDYQYEPYRIPNPIPAVGEEGRNMERLERAYEFRRQLVADTQYIRQHLAAIRMLSNGHLDRETITSDIDLVNTIVGMFEEFDQKMMDRNLNPDHYRHEGTYPWQQTTGMILQKISDDFKLLKLDE